MSAIQSDFDRLALLDSEGWNHNTHYHNFLLRHVPHNCRNALEIGCGTGALARLLAERAHHVLAVDLSSEMIRIARARSARFQNLEFQQADVMSWDFPNAHFDCIVTVATLHHLKLSDMLMKLKDSLRPGGVLLVVDLFEPERKLLTAAGLMDNLRNIAAMGVSGSLRLVHDGRLKPPHEVRAAWEAHGRHDSYLTMEKVRAVCADILPGAKVTTPSLAILNHLAQVARSWELSLVVNGLLR